MRNARTYLIAAAMVIALVMASGLLLFNSAVAQDKAKGKDAISWEYKVIRFHSEEPAAKMEAALNNLGKDSWECVSTVSEVRGGGKLENMTAAVIIFKRPKK